LEAVVKAPSTSWDLAITLLAHIEALAYCMSGEFGDLPHLDFPLSTIATAPDMNAPANSNHDYLLQMDFIACMIRIWKMNVHAESCV
jgi:hypothetical protein